MILQKCLRFGRTVKRAAQLTSLQARRNYQVTVIGGAGGSGVPICMLLKSNPLVSKLVVHDIVEQTLGLAADLFHVASSTEVEGYNGEGELEKALANANIVLICAGTTRLKGATDDQLLKTNAPIIVKVMTSIVKVCPCAFIVILTDPINSITPLAAEALRKAGNYDERKLFGVTNLNLARAQVEFAKVADISPVCVFVPVIGGDSVTTVVPLFSAAVPCVEKLQKDSHVELTKKVRCADKKIVSLKAGTSSVTVSAAYSTALFVQGLLEAMAGNPNIQYAYTQNNDFGTCFFAAPILLDCQGVYETQMVGPLSKLECDLLEIAIDHLRKDVLRGQVTYSEMCPPTDKQMYQC